MRLRRSSSRMRDSGRHLKSLRQPRLRRPTSSRPRARATCPAPQPDGSRPCMCAFRPCSRPCALCVRRSQNSMRCSTMSKRRASMPCPLARIRTSQNGAVTSAYSAASVRRGFLVYPLGGWNLRCDRMRCNALPYALSRTLSRRQASSLRRIARPTGRSLRWCASTPWSSDSTPCCARSISCSLLWKNSMVHSLMSRKSASIGSRRCKDDLSRVRYKNSGGGTTLTPPLWGFEEREKLMGFYERASGARMHANYFRVGGVHQDLPPKLLDDIWAFCDPSLKVCDDIEGLLTENRIFKQRNVNIAVVKLADAWGRGFSGVMVRGSGAAWDLRKAQPYECYSELDFDIPIGKNGDCYDRYLVRMEEMRQSVRIMKQCLEKL